jgi:hypothetical protein
MKKTRKEIQKEVQKNIDAEIKSILDGLGLPEKRKVMLDIILYGGSMEDASGKSTKQWAQSFFSDIATKVWGELKYTRTIFEPYFKDALAKKNIYIKSSNLSEKYTPLVDVKCVKFKKLSYKHNNHILWDTKEMVEEGKEDKAKLVIQKLQAMKKLTGGE